MQLPPSCIRLATVMAARLEVVVSSRMRNRLGKTSDQQGKAQEKIVESPDCFYTGRIGNFEDLSNAYREFFLNLKDAILDGDPAKSFQFLEDARSMAKELITR